MGFYTIKTKKYAEAKRQSLWKKINSSKNNQNAMAGIDNKISPWGWDGHGRTIRMEGQAVEEAEAAVRGEDGGLRDRHPRGPPRGTPGGRRGVRWGRGQGPAGLTAATGAIQRQKQQMSAAARVSVISGALFF